MATAQVVADSDRQGDGGPWHSTVPVTVGDARRCSFKFSNFKFSVRGHGADCELQTLIFSLSLLASPA